MFSAESGDSGALLEDNVGACLGLPTPQSRGASPLDLPGNVRGGFWLDVFDV